MSDVATSVPACLRTATLPRQRHTWSPWEPQEGRSGYWRTCTACGRSQRRRDVHPALVGGVRSRVAQLLPGPTSCHACDGTGWVVVNERGDVARCSHDEVPP